MKKTHVNVIHEEDNNDRGHKARVEYANEMPLCSLPDFRGEQLRIIVGSVERCSGGSLFDGDLLLLVENDTVCDFG